MVKVKWCSMDNSSVFKTLQVPDLVEKEREDVPMGECTVCATAVDSCRITLFPSISFYFQFSCWSWFHSTLAIHFNMIRKKRRPRAGAAAGAPQWPNWRSSQTLPHGKQLHLMGCNFQQGITQILGHLFLFFNRNPQWINRCSKLGSWPSQRRRGSA